MSFHVSGNRGIRPRKHHCGFHGIGILKSNIAAAPAFQKVIDAVDGLIICANGVVGIIARKRLIQKHAAGCFISRPGGLIGRRKLDQRIRLAAV